MLELLRTLLENYGPQWGTALFVTILVVVIMITRIERRVFLHSLRLNFMMLDKDWCTYDDLVKYRLVDESYPTLEVMK